MCNGLPGNLMAAANFFPVCSSSVINDVSFRLAQRCRVYNSLPRQTAKMYVDVRDGLKNQPVSVWQKAAGKTQLERSDRIANRSCLT